MIVKTKDGITVKLLSRWIHLTYKEVSKRHSLYDFSNEGSENGKRIIYSFKHNNKEYCIEQFERLSYPMFYETKDGKLAYLSAYDSTQWYKPFLLELSDDCEYIRLWEEIEA